MGQALSFCPPHRSADHRRGTAARRHFPPHRPATSSIAPKSGDGNIIDAAATRTFRNLLVMVESDDSPIKNRAEYAKSPTVAERIEQEVEDELRRRRRQGEAEEKNNAETDTGIMQRKRMCVPDKMREATNAADDVILHVVEERDEIYNAESLPDEEYDGANMQLM
uniref:Uncharacterized protein n=1 Tax=Minutocellus polymorphus TaxID=265543 RepID=A0A7S0FUI3_9STRA|mmetsp:Transcript_8111/g.13433  ORF Transcript_8111/g.13433 Transcript_8111/m.13433 type:complete len:166 (+) Transcript_8111:170-667(+)